MIVCKSCGNWNPDGTVFCPRCGMHPFEGEMIRRKLNRSLLMAIGLYRILPRPAGRRDNQLHMVRLPDLYGPPAYPAMLRDTRFNQLLRGATQERLKTENGGKHENSGHI